MRALVMGKLQFTEVAVMERLAARTTNPYGEHPDELARILAYMDSVETLLRRTASLEVDTSASVEQVIDAILSLVLTDTGTGEMGGA